MFCLSSLQFVATCEIENSLVKLRPPLPLLLPPRLPRCLTDFNQFWHSLAWVVHLAILS